jgi:hypothetical protein
LVISIEKCTSSRPIKNVYVIQRRINFSSTGGCHLTHSGLLFQMIDGKSCVLEYSSDGNARLSDVHSFYYSYPCWFKVCIIVPFRIVCTPLKYSIEISILIIETRLTLCPLIGRHITLTFFQSLDVQLLSKYS